MRTELHKAKLTALVMAALRREAVMALELIVGAKPQ
jgi:hypothetical protein